MEHVQYQLEEKMGDGKWSRVYETKEESGYEGSPSFKSFTSVEAAKKYANTDTQRWSVGALERGVVRVLVVRTTVSPLVEVPPQKGHKSHHYHAKDALFEATYADSIFDQRLFLTDDGRKRGLWIWLEEDSHSRIEQDSRIFNEGLKRFVEHLKKKPSLTKPENMFEFVMTLKMDFDYFFSHRTEASAIRLSWRKSKLLAAALNKAHRDEKHKSLEDYDDAYGKDAEDDDEDDSEETA